jgi:hypothetical protein
MAVQRPVAGSTRGFRMRRLFLAAAILAAPVAPASADSYKDATTGISVATPDDFAISRGVREGYDLVLHINPVGSYPSRVEGESRLCGLYFKAVPSGETQQWLNAQWKDEAKLAQARRLFDRVMQVKSEDAFSLGDVVGLELVGPARHDPGAVFMMSLANTPRGQLQLTCLLRSDQAVKAMFALRSIRDTVKPPK